MATQVRLPLSLYTLCLMPLVSRRPRCGPKNEREQMGRIPRDTEAKTGRSAGISSQPINLRIFSPILTLADLPGLTRVPVGDHPKVVAKQIRDMLFKYISKSAFIILAVTPANTDLANSDGLNDGPGGRPRGYSNNRCPNKG
jgi:hypothetical protein